jgi:carbon-monoxide dehydrogenase medium subunit
MKPAPFGYHSATSVGEAVRFLAAYEGTARLLAGGQSLVPMLNMRLLQPDALIDINGVAELAGIERTADGVRIGAMTRYRSLEESPTVGRELPLLARVLRHIGDRQIRNRGTIGGSLGHGDPAGEVPLACLVLGAWVGVVGPDGRRAVPVAGLYDGSYATILDPLEIITHIEFPRAPAHASFLELCRRHNDFAVVSVACTGDRDEAGRWTGIRVGVGGLAPTAVVAEAVGEQLSGSPLDDAAIAAAAPAVLDVIDPASDIRASADYRRFLAPVYVQRALAMLRDGAAG